jgi:hypothetical protein
MSSEEKTPKTPNTSAAMKAKYSLTRFSSSHMDSTPVKNTSAVSRLSTIPAPSTANV